MILGKSITRDIYFQKYIQPAKDASEFLVRLSNSPYRTHRRMAMALLPKYKELIAAEQEQLNDLKEDINNVEA